MPSRKQHKIASSDDEGSESLESINCCQLNVHKARIRDERAKLHQHPIHSPLKGRSCTDIICLFIFVVFICAWAVLGYFAFKNGSPEQLFAPLDSQNRRCGFDEEVKDKPVLFFFDLGKCIPNGNSLFHCNTPQICREECPTENFSIDFYINQPGMDLAFVKKMMICRDDFDKGTINSMADAKMATENKMCSRWYVEGTSVAQRCLPKIISDAGNSFVNVLFPIPGSTSGANGNLEISGDNLNLSAEIVKALSAVNEFGHAVVADLAETWPWIIACIAGAMLVSLLYIIIMRWVGGLMVWFSLLGSMGLLGYCSYVTWVRYAELRDEPDPIQNARNVRISNALIDALESQWESFLRMKETWLAFFIISVSILSIILLIVIFLRNRIRLAISLINEGSKAVGYSWTTLIFPVFPWIVQCGVICYSVAICLYLFSSGAPIYRVSGLSTDDCTCSNGYKEDSLCLPELFASQCHNQFGQACSVAACVFDKQEAETYSVYLQLLNLFMFLWSLFFVSGFGQLVLASSFATYYWTFDKKDIPLFTVATATLRVLRYHLGTAAFGSFLLALCNWIRIMIEISYNYLNKYDNTFVKALKCCLSCFFWCLDKFLRFLNKNAYIMCAIHGKNFCRSAKDAFSLLLRNILRVFVLDKVTDFLFFLSKLTITAGMGAISFYLFSEPVPDLNNGGVLYQARYYFIPIIFVCIATYFITSIFFGVYSMAVDTLFLCFLEDSEINDGSLEKPYFMSKELMKILGRKNKKEKPSK